MTEPASDEDFARAFAPLLEVQQRGKMRPATPNDVLEILEVNAGRYVLKGKRGYLAQNGTGWASRQREAIVIPDRAFAHEAKRMGMQQNGVAVNVVRLRRKGTCGIEGVRLRAGLPVKQYENGLIGLGVSSDEAMGMLAALTGAKRADGKP